PKALPDNSPYARTPLKIERRNGGPLRRFTKFGGCVRSVESLPRSIQVDRKRQPSARAGVYGIGGTMTMARSLLMLLAMTAAASVAAAQGAGWIGVTIDDQPDRGVIVRQVAADSPAAKAGVKTGDVLLEFNKQDITGVLQFTRLVHETPSGRTVDL